MNLKDQLAIQSMYDKACEPKSTKVADRPRQTLSGEPSTPKRRGRPRKAAD